jgi:RNA polymerase sigma-70 factor (ECF subfamily)
MGLVVHVVNHTARSRSIRLTPEDRDDLCAQVLLEIVRDDFALLRHFRRQSSLATYLTVVARRVVVHALVKGHKAAKLLATVASQGGTSPGESDDSALDQRLANREEVQRLLGELDESEAQAVRLFHLEGKSYQEISSSVGIAENSVGPLLSRAREKMRRSLERTAP